MKFETGTKVIVKDIVGPSFITYQSEPDETNCFKVRAGKHEDSIEKSYIEGLFFNTLGTYIFGSINYAMLETANPKIYILVDEDNLEEWQMSSQDQTLLYQIVSLNSEYGNIEITEREDFLQNRYSREAKSLFSLKVSA